MNFSASSQTEWLSKAAKGDSPAHPAAWSRSHTGGDEMAPHAPLAQLCGGLKSISPTSAGVRP